MYEKNELFLMVAKKERKDKRNERFAMAFLALTLSYKEAGGIANGAPPSWYQPTLFWVELVLYILPEDRCIDSTYVETSLLIVHT